MRKLRRLCGSPKPTPKCACTARALNWPFGGPNNFNHTSHGSKPMHVQLTRATIFDLFAIYRRCQRGNADAGRSVRAHRSAGGKDSCGRSALPNCPRNLCRSVSATAGFDACAPPDSLAGLAACFGHRLDRGYRNAGLAGDVSGSAVLGDLLPQPRAPPRAAFLASAK